MAMKAVISIVESVAIAFFICPVPFTIVPPSVTVAVGRKAYVVYVIVTSIASIFRRLLAILEAFFVPLLIREPCALISAPVTAIVLFILVAPFVFAAVLVTILAILPTVAVLAVTVALSLTVRVQ